MRGERLPISVAAGALLVPLTAVLAVALVAPSEPSPSETSAREPAIVATPQTQAPAAVAGESLGADLAAACGPAGRELAAVYSNGTATEVQRAALEALRPICAAVGIPLPDDEAVIATTVPSATTPAPDPVTVEAPAPSREDGEWEAEYEDGEWEVDD